MPVFERMVNLPILWMCKEGTVEFERVGSIETLTDADFVADKAMIETQMYTIPSEESLEFTVNAAISRKAMFTLFMGCNKRAIRRAIRWYEKLRRKELKSGTAIADKVWTAVFKAHGHGQWRKRPTER